MYVVGSSVEFKVSGRKGVIVFCYLLIYFFLLSKSFSVVYGLNDFLLWTY